MLLYLDIYIKKKLFFCLLNYFLSDLLSFQIITLFIFLKKKGDEYVYIRHKFIKRNVLLKNYLASTLDILFDCILFSLAKKERTFRVTFFTLKTNTILNIPGHNKRDIGKVLLKP